MKRILPIIARLKITHIKQSCNVRYHYRQTYTIFICYLYFISHTSSAQLPNQALEQRASLDSAQKWQFRFNGLGFVRNNEYFGPIADGYTLFGYQFNPRVACQPAPNVVLEAGVYVKKDFGQDRITQLAPTFTIKFRHRNWNYLFGTLEGSVGHRLIEPLYNFERLLQQRIENGLQINHQTKRTFFDFWISYLQNTLPGYARQEHFWGGLSFKQRICDPGQAWSLSIPVQVTAFHAGGQNISSPLPVRTALNAAGSLSLTWQNPTPGLVRSARLDTYLVGYSENADKPSSGGALYPNLTVHLKPVTVLLSYWNGNLYRADLGGDLYQSYTRRYNSTYREPHRRLLIARFLKDVKITDGLGVTVRFEPHYDLANHLFEHSEGVYIWFGR
ncbi:hypothetical protein ACFQ4C_24920 [Larkinella insperata]|uniref:Uncharacterized protein n=1 Tax=Larkinella insperata TaxID=332158 RepID=A0ABW3QJL0_9BACT|nr:hypothetical protein [Larkinella insperata]